MSRRVRTGSYGDARVLLAAELGDAGGIDRSLVEQADDLLERCERIAATRRGMEQLAALLEDDEQRAVEHVLALLATTHLGEGPGRLLAVGEPMPAERSTRPRLEIHLFGPFRIAYAGRWIEVTRRDKAMEILRYLAAAPVEGVHKDELADRFWPDADERGGKRSLHQAIYTVRRTLATHGAADELSFAGHRYALGGPDRWRDVDRLDECVVAARALASSRHPDELRAVCEDGRRLYVGPFLAEHRHDEWSARRREHYRSRHRELMGHLLDLRAADGDHAAVVELGEWLLELDAADEDAARRVMQAHVSLGRPEAAVAAFARQATHLESELGAPPCRTSKELLARIVQK